jgi:sulfatase maturation enzyme AslB (radical SAM superfamily)
LIKISKICKKNKSKLTVNISIDEIDELYDKIRGTKKGYEKIIKTISAIKRIKKKYFINMGVNITVSKYNVNRFKEILKKIKKDINPDSIVSEFASNRSSFFVKDEKISPETGNYIKTIDLLLKRKNNKNKKVSNIIKLFRNNYYKYIKKYFLKNKKMICYSMYNSAEITNNGNIINCCNLNESAGNLKDNNFDFKKIWFSKKANKIRQKIRQNKCACTLSNPYYTNKIMPINWFK